MNDFSYKRKWIEAEGFRILVPDPLEVEDLYRINAEINEWVPFPYWTRLWPAAFAMARYLREHETWLEGKTVLEWGAGIGLPSFVAARKAATVTLTDYIPEAMEWAEANAGQLKLENLVCAVADWNIGPYPFAEVVLLSDVSYDPDSFDVLAKLINHYLDLGSKIIIALPERVISGKFYQRIEEWILHSGTYLIDERLVVVASLGRINNN